MPSGPRSQDHPVPSGGLAGRRFDVLRQGGPRDVDQCGERGRIADRDLRKVLAVDLDAGGLEALDQPVVGDVVGTSRRVDAGDPQLAEISLAGTPVAVGVIQGVELLLLGFAVKPGPLTAVALGRLEEGPPLLLGVDCALHAGHGVFLFSFGEVRGSASAVQQLLDALGVTGRHRGATVETTGPLG